MSESGGIENLPPEGKNPVEGKSTLSERTSAFFNNLLDNHKMATLTGAIGTGAGVGGMLFQGYGPETVVILSGLYTGIGALADAHSKRLEEKSRRIRDRFRKINEDHSQKDE